MDFVISARFCEPGGGGDESKRCRMGIRTVLNIGSPTEPKFKLAPLQDDPLRAASRFSGSIDRKRSELRLSSVQMVPQGPWSVLLTVQNWADPTGQDDPKEEQGMLTDILVKTPVGYMLGSELPGDEATNPFSGAAPAPASQ